MQKKTRRFLSGDQYLIWGISALLFAYLLQNRTLLYDIINEVLLGYLWVRAQFNTIGDFESDWFVWVPFLIVIAGLTLAIMIYPKPPRFLRRITILALAGVHTLYMAFRTFNTLRFDSLGNGAITLFLWVSEFIFYVSSVSLYIQVLFQVDRKHAADGYEKNVKSGAYQPWVDVFIPTYSEPVEMVRRTLVGCQTMEYPCKRIYLLDDGNRFEMRELAKELDCFYITRAKNIHAKAGNINNALRQTQGELVVFFDADCVPLKNFLSRTVGFFQEQDLALIITAQSFYNADMFSHNIMSLMEQSRFFRHSQRGRDRFNALLCFGTCFVVRRAAMEDIGGMPTETLSEDWATSIKLQAAGYKTYALDEVLGVSAVAESMGEFIQQRVRWTQGTLQALFSSTNPFTIKGLSFMQRIIHAYSIFHYLLNPFYVLIILIPLFYFFFGYAPFYSSSGQFFFFFLPFMALNSLVFSWICREYTSKLSAIVCESFLAIPLSIAAIKTIIRPFGWRFRVTRKGIYRVTAAINWIIGAPLLVFFVLLAVGTFYGYHFMYWYGSQELFYFLFFWSVLRMAALWIGIYAAFDLPQKRKTMRFKHKLACSFTGSKRIMGTAVNISEQGFLFKCENNLEEFKSDSRGFACIEGLKLRQIPVRFTRVNGCYAASTFEDISLDTYRKLIEFLYCRPGQCNYENNLDRKVLNAMVNALCFKNIWSREPREVIARVKPQKNRVVNKWPVLQRILLLSSLATGFVPLRSDAAEQNDHIPATYQHARAGSAPNNKTFLFSFTRIPDEQLKGLLNKMFLHNKDVKIMISTIKRLRAEYGITRSALYPTVNLNTSIGVLRDSTADNKQSRGDYQLSVPVSYEIDVWKRLSAQSRAAWLNSQAAISDREALYVTLTAELLERYYTGLCLREELSLFDEAMVFAVKINKLLRDKYELGMVGKAEVYHSEQTIRRISVSRMSVQSELLRIEHSLKILSGEYPEDSWLKGEFSVPDWLQYVPEGVPVDLVENRPDLRGKKLRIDSAGYRVLAAKRLSFPAVKLTGQTKVSSSETKGFASGPDSSWGIFAQVSFPFFDGHRNKAAYETEVFAQEALTEEHKQILLNAFSEVENALSAGEQQLNIVTVLREHNSFQEQEVAVVELRYNEGVEDLLKLSTEKQGLVFAKIELRSAELGLISHRIQLIRSLGWHMGSD